MAKRKNQSTPSPSKETKKAKTSAKPRVFIENNFKVRVILVFSPTTEKGRISKSPKTPCTLNAEKGKKSVLKSPSAADKRKEIKLKSPATDKGMNVKIQSPKVAKEVTMVKSPMLKGNLQFWQENRMLLKEFEDKIFG